MTDCLSNTPYNFWGTNKISRYGNNIIYNNIITCNNIITLLHVINIITYNNIVISNNYITGWNLSFLGYVIDADHYQNNSKIVTNPNSNINNIT